MLHSVEPGLGLGAQGLALGLALDLGLVSCALVNITGLAYLSVKYSVTLKNMVKTISLENSTTMSVQQLKYILQHSVIDTLLSLRKCHCLRFRHRRTRFPQFAVCASRAHTVLAPAISLVEAAQEWPKDFPSLPCYLDTEQQT